MSGISEVGHEMSQTFEHMEVLDVLAPKVLRNSMLFWLSFVCRVAETSRDTTRCFRCDGFELCASSAESSRGDFDCPQREMLEIWSDDGRLLQFTYTRAACAACAFQTLVDCCLRELSWSMLCHFRSVTLPPTGLWPGRLGNCRFGPPSYH